MTELVLNDDIKDNKDGKSKKVVKTKPKKKRRKKFDIGSFVITVILTIIVIVTIIPVINLLAVSFSEASVVNKVVIIPLGFNFDSYSYLFQKSTLFRSLGLSILRCVLGTLLQTVVAILVAYPLSKKFKGRTLYAWFFFLGMIFDGGVIPFYMVVRELGMYNSFLSLIIPSTVQVFNIILLTNFFKEIPKEIEESARADGAGFFRSLFQVVLPISKPVIATSIVFSMVGHWNAWLDGVMFINLPENQPLATFIQAYTTSGTIIPTYSDKISKATVDAALIIFGMVPMVIAYPCLQKYFKKGLIVGSMKG